MKILKRIFSIVVVLLIVMVGLYRLAVLTERKDSQFKYKPFYQQKENFDVLFMGSSHVINGIFPMELWRDYGIVSYNFGGHANSLAISYWQMVNAFDYTTPRLVVIDCYSLSGQLKFFEDDKSYTHLSLDAIPLSINKVRAVRDLLDNKNQREFLFDFDIYHNRWKGLGKGDFVVSASKEKGAESRVGVAVPSEFAMIGHEEKLEEDTVSIAYLRKMISYCQEKGIDVLLIYLPFPAGKTSQKEANTVFDIAEEYNVHYLDFSTLRSLVNFDTDCYDKASHLNPSGGRKVTAYIGEYIMKHYDINDQRNNTAYKEWYEAYETYVEYKTDTIKNQKSLKTHLMLLNDKEFSFSIYIKDTESFLDDVIIRKLLENVGIDINKILKEKDALITVDHLGDQVIYSKSSESQETSFGQIGILEEENKHNICVAGNTKLEMESQDEVGIIVFSHENFKSVAMNRFKRMDVEYNVVK